MLQAFGYVLCYVDTSILPCTNHMILEDMKMDVPYALRLTPRLINPGQGTLNILTELLDSDDSDVYQLLNC